MKQYILDTNIISRYLVKDNLPQYESACDIILNIEKEKYIGYLSILVIDEIIWVMESYYDFARTEYIPRLLDLFALKNLKCIEVNKAIIIRALQMMQDMNIDFTDIYLSLTAGKTPIFSFDKDFKKLK